MLLPAFEISMYWHERVHMDLANVWLRKQVVSAADHLTMPERGAPVL